MNLATNVVNEYILVMQRFQVVYCGISQKSLAFTVDNLGYVYTRAKVSGFVTNQERFDTGFVLVFTHKT